MGGRKNLDTRGHKRRARVGLLHVVVTAAVQAVMAFFPIGSSGQIYLLETATGWAPFDAQTELAAYVGMLLAVVGYFWRDVLAFATGVGQLCRGRLDAEARLLVYVALATVPAGAAALALAATDLLPVPSPTTVAWLTLAFGTVLWLADRIGVTVRRLSHMGWSAALIVGVAQIVALVPGVGRPGIAVTLARGLGFERVEAARFSLLLAMPTLVVAIALDAIAVSKADGWRLTADAGLAGVVALIMGLAAIAMLMAGLRKGSFARFAVYRLAAGAAFLGWRYFA